MQFDASRVIMHEYSSHEPKTTEIGDFFRIKLGMYDTD